MVGTTFREFDLLLTPMVPIPPFAAEADGPPDMDPSPLVPWARWTPFSYPFNITGQPAASIPCGWTPAGLPVGLQVIGRRFADLSVLQFCAQWERHCATMDRRPAVLHRVGGARGGSTSAARLPARFPRRNPGQRPQES